MLWLCTCGWYGFHDDMALVEYGAPGCPSCGNDHNLDLLSHRPEEERQTVALDAAKKYVATRKVFQAAIREPLQHERNSYGWRHAVSESDRCQREVEKADRVFVAAIAVLGEET